MVLSHLQNERETERKEKSQLLEHRCTVMVRSGCWSACLNSEGSHHGRSRGLPRHRVHWFPSQGPMSAWLITRTTCPVFSYLPAACMTKSTTCRTHRPAASYEPTRWMWAEPALTSSLCSCAPPLLGRLVCLMLISSHVEKHNLWS